MNSNIPTESNLPFREPLKDLKWSKIRDQIIVTASPVQGGRRGRKTYVKENKSGRIGER